MIAVNDGVVLRNHIPRILRKHFREKPYYVDLLDLFNEVVDLQSVGLISFHFNRKLKANLCHVSIGGIPNCFRSDDRFDHYYSRRKRSIQILFVNVSEILYKDYCNSKMFVDMLSFKNK